MGAKAKHGLSPTINKRGKMNMDIVGKVFGSMFAVIFFYYLLSQGFATVMPTATAITVWGLSVTFIVTLSVLGAVLYGGYRIIKSAGWK